MKALLLHCRNYKIKVGLLANRPHNVQPEPVTESEQSQADGVIVLITAEKGDSQETLKSLRKDIAKMAEDVGRKSIVILPFAHLSNNLLDSSSSIKLFENLKKDLAGDFEVKRGHFGSHKEFLLDVFGHPGNVRYREY
ncbi:MAG TPA: threonyl-tRNA synthetase editing domain-containing protein [Candidatus Saccharimonadales bacterium]|nr:threonyl-tRNA synthetase editing domain-containing protein [Candidatus Saccharimonadales bacterium]